MARYTPRSLLVKYQKELLIRATPAEIALYNMCKKAGIIFQFQVIVYHKGRGAIVDFLFPRKANSQLIVELDGGYHYQPEQQAKDAERTTWLQSVKPCDVLRFDNRYATHHIPHIFKAVIAAGVKTYERVYPAKPYQPPQPKPKKKKKHKNAWYRKKRSTSAFKTSNKPILIKKSK